MIINTGGRTDTVQYYSEWLLKRFAGDRANRGTNLFVDCNPLE